MSDYAENAIDATIAHQPSPGERFYPAFEVTPELDAAASEYVTHYPEGKQKSAVLPILHEIQKKFGFISGDAIAWVGEKLNISAAHVLGVVTFYPGLRQMCPGKNHIRVCRTLSCAMAGAETPSMSPTAAAARAFLTLWAPGTESEKSSSAPEGSTALPCAQPASSSSKERQRASSVGAVPKRTTRTPCGVAAFVSIHGV